MEEKENDNVIQTLLNRSTLEVAKSIIDDDDYDRYEARIAFISVWATANALFKQVAEIYDDPTTSKNMKKKWEDFYKGIPVGWNLPLEVRIPPDLRQGKLASLAEQARVKAGAPGPIIVKGYNDPESLKDWEKVKQENEKPS